MAKFKTHAERIAQVKVLLKGTKGLSADMKPVDAKLKELEKELEIYIDADAGQESLKAELNKATKELNKSAGKIDGLYRRVVDYAYSVYGKQGTELKKLGLMPWATGRKVSKPKV
ncbi:hypothetical protein HY768_09550 [candidate division TA06 bacterium]|uniref:Uncharacterized protein n=1 Tax=candidate division TA06 bacterium TaxID=2250710 RepID=A0A933IAX5_UNCT6|nr:hypothetical protein [candidate division TA06 bacterium]